MSKTKRRRHARAILATIGARVLWLILAGLIVAFGGMALTTTTKKSS
ncbi:hypothetical protein N7326_02365 [Corynebacterium sp. ES2794-CONJ1]|nr:MULTISPECIES: hypothetical protein [unclassified Corynebacterium]MCS4490763.1 hypothetical protein [Corynebacterium sp. ES2775-CONJ]MCS4492401.1 hypothetical protein [Corynebacterium sp. ES2715-CONJ3]MCU9518718.1 hypothetical protein [Corynebacterium sp. ES2794-CONJ1]